MEHEMWWKKIRASKAHTFSRCSICEESPAVVFFPLIGKGLHLCEDCGETIVKAWSHRKSGSYPSLL